MLVLPYKLPTTLRVTSQRLREHAKLVSLALALFLFASHAAAEDKSVLAAASAFTQGQQAELSGNNERAAELFELADRIAPTPEALRSATRARRAAGHLASAAGHAEALLSRYESDAQSRELAEEVLARAKPELARFTFQCSEPCSVVVDGLAAGLSPLKTQVIYLSPGSHELVIGFDGELTRSLHVQGSAGEARTIKVPRPAPRAVAASEAATSPPASSVSDTMRASAPAARSRLSPAYFWIAAGVTVATGALTLWSGLDDLKSRDEFKSSAHPTRSQFDDGESKDRRTSVLIGATSVLAVGTAALALFTDFAGDRSERSRAGASLSVDTRGAAHLSYGGRF
ncbi:MAG: hypothetical protein JWN04_616 [Myxococcaceae bacterium]|nr:hypothetical protein [Myxococcaceae bacterium]